MRDTIDTIPVTDAFKAGDECPFCYIERALEQDAISYTLGASYMEEDMRALTDQMGFCRIHYKKLYDYGNRLGLALILQTRYQTLEKQMTTLLENINSPKPTLMQKLKKELPKQAVSSSIQESVQSCYICERIEKNRNRYARTFFHLIHTSEDFRALFKNSKGFCLHHLSYLLEEAPLYLKPDDLSFFITTSRDNVLNSLSRIEEDLGWFIDKYDYRNKDAPWKNAKDAIPRGIQKIVGSYVQDEPFTSSDGS